MDRRTVLKTTFALGAGAVLGSRISTVRPPDKLPPYEDDDAENPNTNKHP